MLSMLSIRQLGAPATGAVNTGRKRAGLGWLGRGVYVRGMDTHCRCLESSFGLADTLRRLGLMLGVFMSLSITSVGDEFEPPIRHMWECGTPQAGVRGAGFPILEKAEHRQLYLATQETGGYSHHSRLFHHGGRFYAMWSNHRHGEDGPGQRVLWSWSDDGETWRKWTELYPSPMPMEPSDEPGFVLTAGGWKVVGDRLFALASANSVVGFENSERTSFRERPDRVHKFRRRERRGRFAREVLPDGTLGEIFCLGKTPPEQDQLTFKAAPSDDLRFAPLAKAIREQFPRRRLPKGIDTNRLCEATYYQAKDGRQVVLMRDDCYSHRLYVSISDDGLAWPIAYPTDIPDSPSLTTNAVLADGTVLLIGNQMAPAFDNPGKPDHYGRDPLLVSVSADGYTFSRAYALRCGQQEWHIPRKLVRGRGGGAQYPSALVHGKHLYVLYSMGKEDVWISRVPLSDLGLSGAR